MTAPVVDRPAPKLDEPDIYHHLCPACDRAGYAPLALCGAKLTGLPAEPDDVLCPLCALIAEAKSAVCPHCGHAFHWR